MRLSFQQTAEFLFEPGEDTPKFFAVVGRSAICLLMTVVLELAADAIGGTSFNLFVVVMTWLVSWLFIERLLRSAAKCVIEMAPDLSDDAEIDHNPRSRRER